MQALPELLEWLKTLGLSDAALVRMESGVFRVPPSLTVARANYAALQDELLMSDAQVRCIKQLDVTSSCAA